MRRKGMKTSLTVTGSRPRPVAAAAEAEAAATGAAGRPPRPTPRAAEATPGPEAPYHIRHERRGGIPDPAVLVSRLRRRVDRWPARSCRDLRPRRGRHALRRAPDRARRLPLRLPAPRLASLQRGDRVGRRPRGVRRGGRRPAARARAGRHLGVQLLPLPAVHGHRHRLRDARGRLPGDRAVALAARGCSLPSAIVALVLLGTTPCSACSSSRRRSSSC